MIASHWFRRLILVCFYIEVAGGVLWVVAWMAPDSGNKPLAQMISSLAFLFGYYAVAPLSARFLAPTEANDPHLQQRMANIVATLPGSSPVFLYDHNDKEANSVGLFHCHSRIYVTTGLLLGMSDVGMRAVIAHENSHIRGRHIPMVLSYAIVFVAVSHYLTDIRIFLVMFFGFLMLRRYCEYLADAGAVQLTSLDETVKALGELKSLYPSPAWLRWLSFASAYPTLAMRLQAITTGHKALL